MGLSKDLSGWKRLSVAWCGLVWLGVAGWCFVRQTEANWGKLSQGEARWGSLSSYVWLWMIMCVLGDLVEIRQGRVRLWGDGWVKFVIENTTNRLNLRQKPSSLSETFLKILDPMIIMVYGLWSWQVINNPDKKWKVMTVHANSGQATKSQYGRTRISQDKLGLAKNSYDKSG